MATKHIPINPKQYPSPAGPQQPKTVYVDPNQYREPIGPRQQTTFEKIRRGAGDIANAAYDAGAQARAVGHEIGQNPRVKQIRSQSGFSSQSPRPRSRQRRDEYDAGYDGRPREGERITITRCDETGHCRSTTLKGGPKQPSQRRRPSWASGVLGGDDPGFY